MTEAGDPPLRVEINPALLVKKRVYTLQQDRLSCATASGEAKWQIDLTEVRRAAFVTHRIDGNHMWRFDLLLEGGDKQSVALTFPVVAGMRDPDCRAFVVLAHALSQRLSQIAADLPVALAEYGESRFWYFLIGILSAMGGCILMLIALTDDLTSDRMWVAILGSGLLTVMGAALVYGYRPWIGPPTVPVVTLTDTFAALEKAGAD